jgi:hypothetical protein
VLVAILHQLEEKTGVRALWIAIGAGVFFIGLVFFGLGAGVICVCIGFLYPVYMSFKTIESKEPEHLKQWYTDQPTRPKSTLSHHPICSIDIISSSPKSYQSIG